MKRGNRKSNIGVKGQQHRSGVNSSRSSWKLERTANYAVKKKPGRIHRINVA